MSEHATTNQSLCKLKLKTTTTRTAQQWMSFAAQHGAFLAPQTKVMAAGQPVGSIPVSCHPATFSLCASLTRRLPGDPRPPRWCGTAHMALILQPGVDWAPLKPVTHVAFVWQPSRCKNWGHIPPVTAMCSLSSEHSGWCHSTTTPLPPTLWHLCGHPRPSRSALMKSN